MVPELILFALLLGWILGGKFWRLADAKIRFGWMIFVPLFLYAICWLPPLQTRWFFGGSALIAQIVLIVLALVNWKVAGVKLIVVGLLLNFVALSSNGGLMPASPGALAATFGTKYVVETRTAVHPRSSIMDTSTELGFLCDVIAAHRPFALVPAVYSAGDLVMTIGIFLAIIGIMRTPLPSEKAALKEAPCGNDAA